MSKAFDATDHGEEQRSYENRQHALELLQDACVKGGVCAACGSSAGLYLACLAAIAIGYDRAGFLELAAEVWDDLQRQAVERPSN